jgi:tripartite-type tricarboxylate transporter receptor subunit TctC
MKLPRREFLRLAAGAAALPAVPLIASAQAYPAQPVRIIVGFAPGGGMDIMARLIGQWLSERFGQQFVIENRPGAGTNIATEAVVNAPPDGYTLLLAGFPNASNATLYGNLKFNFIRDIAPVAGLSRETFLIEVNPSLWFKTVPEFITHANANPGKINMASAGIGSGNHIAGELFKMMTGVNIVHIPYRGPAGAFTDLLAGQIQAFIITVPAAIGFVRTGKLRALAVTGATRADVMPDVPAMAELLPGFDATAWDGTCAPAGTPAEIIDRLNATITAGLADPQLKAKIKDLGGEPMPMTPAEFGKFLAAETEKWGKVVKFSGIKPN